MAPGLGFDCAPHGPDDGLSVDDVPVEIGDGTVFAHLYRRLLLVVFVGDA